MNPAKANANRTARLVSESKTPVWTSTSTDKVTRDPKLLASLTRKPKGRKS